VVFVFGGRDPNRHEYHLAVYGGVLDEEAGGSIMIDLKSDHRYDAMLANARRKYHHVLHGGNLTEADMSAIVRDMEQMREAIRVFRTAQYFLDQVCDVIAIYQSED
jgi:hypothetical protein